MTIYEATDGRTQIDVWLEDDAVRLTQRQMGARFETTLENVLMHLRNIFDFGELSEPATATNLLADRRETGGLAATV